MKPGDWVKHPQIEQALILDKVDGDTAWLRTPGPDGWPFPVHFALPVQELKRTVRPTDPKPPFEEAPF